MERIVFLAVLFGFVLGIVWLFLPFSLLSRLKKQHQTQEKILELLTTADNRAQQAVREESAERVSE